MMTATAMVLATVGFGALALSMHKHHRDLLGAPPPRWRRGGRARPCYLARRCAPDRLM
jgi:hypothetical protein